MLKKILNEVKKYEYKLDLIWFILFPIFNIVYIVANNMYKKGFDLTITVDKQLPLIPIFVLPYVYWYFFMIIGYFIISIENRKEYMRSLLGLFVGMWISYIIYFVFPTEIVRPVITEGGFLNFMIKTIYLSDRPFNCFPSLHVLGTYFVMRYTKKENDVYIYYYTEIMGFLIILSTLFIKQHFVLDIVISIAMVEIIRLFVRKISDETVERCLNLPYSIFNKVIKKYKELMLN